MTEQIPAKASTAAAVDLDEFQAFAAKTDVSETAEGAHEPKKCR